MLKETQTARISEESKGGHSKWGPMLAKDLVWAIYSGLNSLNKKNLPEPAIHYFSQERHCFGGGRLFIVTPTLSIQVSIMRSGAIW